MLNPPRLVLRLALVLLVGLAAAPPAEGLVDPCAPPGCATWPTRVEVFCPEYNDEALTNACVAVDLPRTGTSVPGVSVGGVCVVGDVCIEGIAIAGTTVWHASVDTNVYVEATILCGAWIEVLPPPFPTVVRIPVRCRVGV